MRYHGRWLRQSRSRLSHRKRSNARLTLHPQQFTHILLMSVVLIVGCSPGARYPRDAVLTSPTDMLGRPTDFQSACEEAPHVCRVSDPVSAANLFRDWTDVPNESTDCTSPATAPPPRATGLGGERITVEGGPISIVLTEVPPVSTNAVSGSGEHWRGTKALFLSDPGYDGPFLVRGRNTNTGSRMAFGEGPALAWLLAPPGPSTNSVGGFRQYPGGLYVTEAGCFALRIDGPQFAYEILIDVRAW